MCFRIVGGLHNKLLTCWLNKLER